MNEHQQEVPTCAHVHHTVYEVLWAVLSSDLSYLIPPSQAFPEAVGQPERSTTMQSRCNVLAACIEVSKVMHSNSAPAIPVHPAMHPQYLEMCHSPRMGNSCCHAPPSHAFRWHCLAKPPAELYP
eukprot:4229705-Amphidinium_carterae.1